MDTPIHARESWTLTALAILLACTGAIATGGAQSPQAPREPYREEIEAIRLLHGKGDYRAALERSRTLAGRVEQDPGAEPLLVASVLDALVESLTLAESPRDEILPLARRALELNERIAGPDDRRTAYSRMNLAGVLANAGNLKEANALLERSLDVFQRELGPNDELTARALSNLAQVANALGDLKSARDYAERGVRAAEAALGPEDIGLAKALINLASSHDRAGDIKTAIQIAERAAEIMRKAYKGDHPLLAVALSNLAFNMDRANEFAKSDALHKESLRMLERTVGPESVDFAWELNNYGLLFWRLGDFEAGRLLFERALAIWTKAGSPQASRALNNLAITYRRLGDFAAARSHYERSLAIKEQALGRDHQEVALVLFNTANLLKNMGDYETARPLYERALSIREKRLGPMHTQTAYSLNGLGEVLNELGEQSRARPLVERAVRIWRELKAPDMAIGLSTLAEISSDAGDLTSALRYYDEGRELYEKTFGPNYIDVAILLNNSASVLARRGDYELARQRYARALVMLERQFDAEHPNIAEVTAGLATMHWQLGDTPQALTLALRSERIGREHFRLTSRTLSEREAMSFSETRAPALDVLMTLAVSGELGPNDRRSVMDAAIRSRALVLDEVIQRNRLAGAESRSSEIPVLKQAVLRARQRLANLIVRGPRPGEDGYAALVADARAERDLAERRLAAGGLGQRDQLARERAGLAEVAAALPADAAIVTFVKYDHLSRESVPTAPVSPTSDSRYAALFLRGGPSADVTVIAIGRVSAVDAQVARWRQAIVPSARSGAISERAYRRIAGTLSETIWNPVARHLGDTRQLFLVPDGALNLVSFAALPDARNRYLVENDTLLHYLSAERDLVTSGVADRPSGGLLTVGNPLYSRVAGLHQPGEIAPVGVRGTSGCPEFQRVRFERLPGADREVRDVVALWTAHAHSNVAQLSGDRATESAFKQAAPNHRILHLATHGFFLGSCGPAGAGTRGVGGLAVKGRPTALSSRNVGALSGLALAGANQRATAGQEDDDGILTAEEVAGLDLHAVEWAVLSACDTGLGEVRGGEGVFGLRRAFATAGARTTIMSLWSVEDRSTREWMAALYRARLIDMRSTADSVRDASRVVLQSRRARGLSTHPFYWAAFVAAGDWK